MCGLSREASAVHKDSNNECRGVSRGRSSRPRVGQGEGPNCALSHTTICVRGNFCSQMSEKELSFQDDRAYPDNREEATMSIMRSYNEIRFAQNRRMPNGTYGGVRGTETKVGQKTFVSRPTRLSLTAAISKIALQNYSVHVGRILSIRNDDSFVRLQDFRDELRLSHCFGDCDVYFCVGRYLMGWV